MCQKVNKIMATKTVTFEGFKFIVNCVHQSRVIALMHRNYFKIALSLSNFKYDFQFHSNGIFELLH